ncbi:MAG: hypothetical protein LRY68_11915 [Sulfurospirillum sp.]|nr:hypothetical protein [Sulfurospirillum sp.]
MFSSLAISFAEANRYFNAELSSHFRSIDEGSSSAIVLIFALSFAYGVLHALGPGHGKALVAGYVLANPSKKNARVSIRLFDCYCACDICAFSDTGGTLFDSGKCHEAFSQRQSSAVSNFRGVYYFIELLVVV